MSKKGQIDGVILAVSFLTLALIGIIIASPSGMSGLFTAGSQEQAEPTISPILSQYTPVPSAQPTYTGIPIIDQSYYPVPVIQPSPTPYGYPYGGQYPYGQNPYQNPYNPYGNYNGYQPYAPSYYSNGTPYYPPGYQNYFNYYPNGTPMYGTFTQYAYCYSNYTGSFPTSVNVITGRAPVNVFIDGSYCGSITTNGSSFMAFGLAPGYHSIYVSGNNCYKVESVYTTYQYQTNINVCNDGTTAGGRTLSGDGTYYLYQGDKVVATSGATFVYTSFSTLEYGQSALPMASFTVTPSSGSSQTLSLTVASETYQNGGSMRINGALETPSGKLFGVTVSSTGNLQPAPIGTRTLSGRIVDQNGTGIANAAIMIVNTYDPQLYMNTKIAGVDGYYTMPYVPDGMYNVTVTAANHYRRIWTFVQVSSDQYANYDIASTTSTVTPTPTPSPSATPTPTPTNYAELGFRSFYLGTYMISDGVGIFLSDSTNTSHYSACYNGVCRYPAYTFTIANTGTVASGPFNVSINNASVTQNAAFYFGVDFNGANYSNPFSSLAATSSTSATVYGIPTSASLLAYNYIDPNNSVNELSRANNSLVFPINVLPYTAPTTRVTLFGFGGVDLYDADENYSTGILQIMPVTNNTTYFLSGQSQFDFFDNRTNISIRYLYANRTLMAGEHATYYTTGGRTINTNIAPFSDSIHTPDNASYAVLSFMTGVRGITIGQIFAPMLTYTNGTQIISNPDFNPSDYENTTWAGLNLANASLNRWIVVNN